MKLLRTPKSINLWKIIIFLLLFMLIDTATAFFGVGIVLLLKHFSLISLFNVPTVILLELVIRYGLAFMLIVWINRHYLKQTVWFKPMIPFKNQAYPLLLAGFMILIYVFTVNLGILKYDANNVSFFMFSLGSALLEEYGFRGVIFPKIMQVVKGSTYHKLMFGVIGSGILFGLIHFQNIFYQPLFVTLQQVAGAIPFGILMAVLYARTSTILVPILFHFASDFNSYFSTNSFFAGAFYNSWWQVLIDYGIALLAAIIFLRPTVADKIKFLNHD